MHRSHPAASAVQPPRRQGRAMRRRWARLAVAANGTAIGHRLHLAFRNTSRHPTSQLYLCLPITNRAESVVQREESVPCERRCSCVHILMELCLCVVTAATRRCRIHPFLRASKFAARTSVASSRCPPGQRCTWPLNWISCRLLPIHEASCLERSLVWYQRGRMEQHNHDLRVLFRQRPQNTQCCQGIALVCELESFERHLRATEFFRVAEHEVCEQSVLDAFDSPWLQRMRKPEKERGANMLILSSGIWSALRQPLGSSPFYFCRARAHC